MLVSAFLAGAYISFGGLVAITVSSGLDPETWGTLPTLFMGAAFTLGLVLVLIAGSDLATGNMMLVPLSAMRGKIGVGDVARNLTLVLLGNLLGAMFVAYFLAVQTGVIGHAGASGSAGLTYERLAAIASAKATGESHWQVFLRGDRLQLAGLPGGLDVAGREVGVGQDPGDLLPDHGVRGDGLRPRRGQHVLPPGGDLGRACRTSAGATRC